MIKDGPEVMDRLGEIKAPTLIVTGEVDIPDVQAHAGALEALIPSARRVIVPDSGHFLYLEQPQAFADLVSAFVTARP
jgi:pimeloyl-ACP methyl ester carboxylesterase